MLLSNCILHLGIYVSNVFRALIPGTFSAIYDSVTACSSLKCSFELSYPLSLAQFIWIVWGVFRRLMPVIILVLWHTFSLLVPLCCYSSTEGVHLSPQAFVSPDIIFASLFQIYPCSLTSSCLSTTVGAATDLSLSSWDGLTNTSTHSQRTQWMAS